MGAFAPLGAPEPLPDFPHAVSVADVTIDDVNGRFLSPSSAIFYRQDQ